MDDETYDNNKSSFKQHGTVSTTEVDGKSYDFSRRETNTTGKNKKSLALGAERCTNHVGHGSNVVTKGVEYKVPALTDVRACTIEVGRNRNLPKTENKRKIKS